MKKKYESELIQVIHEEMQDMHRSGFISDARMKEFDEMCLLQEDETTEEAEKPVQIKQVTA